MLANLLAGSLVICLTVLIHTFGLIAITHVMSRLIDRFRLHGRRSRVLAMITTVLGILGVMTVEVWLWASAYMVTGSFDNFQTALYFSTVTFSTLGYGDIVPHAEWRLFAGLEGINGFLLIGWSTAYLVAAGTRVGPFRTGEHF